LFLGHLDRTRREPSFKVWAYVLMPDHVHILVRPKDQVYDIAAFRKSLKQPFAREALSQLKKADDPLLKRLSTKPNGKAAAPKLGKAGAGYDRNIHSTPSCKKSIAYIHGNPVAEELCEHPWD